MAEVVEKPVLKSVFVVALTMVAIWLAFVAGYYAFDFGPPSSVGSVILSTAVGVGWFGRKVQRRMEKAERVRFATGVLIVNAVLPTAYVIGSLLYLGMPVTLTSFDLAFGEGSGFFMEAGFAWLMAIILALSFAQAYFLAWLLLRKLDDGLASA